MEATIVLFILLFCLFLSFIGSYGCFDFLNEKEEVLLRFVQTVVIILVIYAIIRFAITYRELHNLIS
jgi:hypothetical protein